MCRIFHLWRGAQTGSWEGGSASWIAEHLLKHPASLLVCLDTWDVRHRADNTGFNIADVEVRAADTIRPNVEAHGMGTKTLVMRDMSNLSREKRWHGSNRSSLYHLGVRILHPSQGRDGESTPKISIGCQHTQRTHVCWNVHENALISVINSRL